MLRLLHSAEILSRIPPKENPPPDRPAPAYRRAFKMASGIEVLHGRCKKSILGPLLASLGNLCGACLGTLAGQGWHWRASGCLFCAFLGYALWGLGFDTLPERKSDDFGTAFCAENIINNILFVHCTVSAQTAYFLRFFGGPGLPFWMPWGSFLASGGPLGLSLLHRWCPWKVAEKSLPHNIA